MVLYTGANEGSTGSVSGLKHLRRWGHDLVSSDKLVERVTKCGPVYKATCFLVVELKP